MFLTLTVCVRGSMWPVCVGVCRPNVPATKLYKLRHVATAAHTPPCSVQNTVMAPNLDTKTQPQT